MPLARSRRGPHELDSDGEPGVRMIKTREARPGDLITLVALFREVQSFHREGDPSRYSAPDNQAALAFFEQVFAKGDIEVWIAEDGAPLGYASLMIENRPRTPFSPGGRLAYVGELVVHAAHRRQGVGRTLMEMLERRARELGCERVVLDVAAFNSGARAFYSALGYADERVRMVRMMD